MDFYESWWFLKNHKIFNDSFEYDGFWTYVPKVNPETLSIDDDKMKNTKVRVWLEAFPIVEGQGRIHDYDLDCGGDTFEEAIIELARLVMGKYGDN